jgi:hypothetical protein
MKYLSNEHGALPVLIAILVLAFVVAAGVAIYTSVHHSKLPTVASKLQPSPSSSASPSAGPSPTPSTTVAFGETVPTDFGTYITSIYDADKEKCVNTTFSMTLPVVRDEFAAVNEGCGAGNEVFYAKISGRWQTAFGTQNIPDCSDIDKFSFTKMLVQKCWSPDNVLIDNTNP